VLLPEAEGTTEYPLTLETPFGDTVLEERPERIAIVTASTVDTDALIALGGTPVFAPSTIDRNPWLGEAAQDIDVLWESEAGAEVAVEQVAASEPDLIVSLDASDTFDQARFDQVSAIAPVLHAESGDLTWQELTRELGEAVDLTAAADTVIEESESQVEALAAEHPEFAGKTAAHVIVYPEDWGAAYVSTPGSDTEALFDSLGFELTEEAANFDEDDVVSGELIGRIDADFLLVSTFGEESEYFLESPLYRKVPAVEDGRVAVNDDIDEAGTNSLAWGLNQQSALSIPWMLDAIAGHAEAALD
jgi:iron complex transport system substrate-binding protein